MCLVLQLLQFCPLHWGSGFCWWCGRHSVINQIRKEIWSPCLKNKNLNHCKITGIFIVNLNIFLQFTTSFLHLQSFPTILSHHNQSLYPVATDTLHNTLLCRVNQPCINPYLEMFIKYTSLIPPLLSSYTTLCLIPNGSCAADGAAATAGV